MADSHHRRGIALAEAGWLDAAYDAFAAAAAQEPGRAAYHYSLAKVRRFTPDDARLPAMLGLAQRLAELPPVEQVHLCFALGKAATDLGDNARAFHHYLRGNAIQRQLVGYDEAASLGFLQRIRERITPQDVAAKRGHGIDSALPVFILGMPRSGSTLVEQILAAHPQVAGGGELHHFGRAMTAVMDARRYPDIIAALPGEALRGLGDRYAAALRGVAPRVARITDKMPTNYLFAGLIHLALPQAVIIHTVRDPVDCCLSNFTTLYAAGRLPYTYDLGELGRYYRAYDTLMRHWHHALPNVIFDVQYERLVTDFETTAREIVARCGLPWDEACLAFHTTQRRVRTASVSQVRQPLYREAIGRWRHQAALYEPLLQALHQ